MKLQTQFVYTYLILELFSSAKLVNLFFRLIDFLIDVSLLLVQLLLFKSMDGADIEWCKEVRGNMYDMVVEGFQLLSRWTARIWEQCAWKFSRPCKDPVYPESNEMTSSFSDYEKVTV